MNTYRFRKHDSNGFELLEIVKNEPERFVKTVASYGTYNNCPYKLYVYEGIIKAKSLEEAKKRIQELGT